MPQRHHLKLCERQEKVTCKYSGSIAKNHKGSWNPFDVTFGTMLKSCLIIWKGNVVSDCEYIFNVTAVNSVVVVPISSLLLR